MQVPVLNQRSIAARHHLQCRPSHCLGAHDLAAVLLAIMLVVLLLTVESSLQTSIVLDRGRAWTPWLYKVGPLSVSDFVIMGVAAFTIFTAGRRFGLPRSKYLILCGLALLYLLFGLFYNLAVYTYWKTYLYDIKVVLYLTMPYLFLHNIHNKRITAWFRPELLFIYGALASILDTLMVTMFGHAEYPSNLGLPPWSPLVPIPVLIIALVFSRKHWHRVFFAVLIGLELVNLVNRGSLGALFGIGTSIVYIFIAVPRLSYLVRTALVIGAVIGINLFSVFLIMNPLNWPLLTSKADGSAIRQTQLSNALANFEDGYSLLTGKGLGATWFEYIKANDPAGYSTGTSVGATFQESLAAPVKFIFNWTPPSLLYKWGFLGTLGICVLATAYFQEASARIRRLRRIGSLARSNLRYLQAVLLISFIFTLDNFTYIGQLKPSLITSLLAFYVESNLRSQVIEAQVLGGLE